MNSLDKIPLLNKEKRQQQPYLRRWLGILTLTFGGGLLLNSTLNHHNQPTPINTEQTIVKPGQTPWSIATNENKTVATNPNLMAQQIEHQIPKSQNGMLYPGETIYLPAGSKNGIPVQNTTIRQQ